jgi:hypothetical protein
MPNTEEISRLVTWTINPDPPEAIYSILEELDDQDLNLLMFHFGGKPGLIAWAEFGKRKGYADFQVHAQYLKGSKKQIVEMVFEAEAKPIHENVILGLRKDDG